MYKRVIIVAIVCLVAIVVWFSTRSDVDLADNRATPESNAASSLSERSLDDVAVAKKKRLRAQQLQKLALMTKLAQKRAPLPPDDNGENEMMAEEAKNTPEQTEWRNTWIDEGEDVEWTKKMEDEILKKANSLLTGSFDVRHLSCRETVCRMYLQFEGVDDVEAFTSAESPPEYMYGFQHLNPPLSRVKDSQGVKYNFELMVKRDRPANLPDNIKSRTAESHSSRTEGSANAENEG